MEQGIAFRSSQTDRKRRRETFQIDEAFTLSIRIARMNAKHRYGDLAVAMSAYVQLLHFETPSCEGAIFPLAPYKFLVDTTSDGCMYGCIDDPPPRESSDEVSRGLQQSPS